MKSIIDSHLHLDLIDQAHPQRIQWLLDHHCTVISWAFSPEIGTFRALNSYLRRQKATVGRIHRETGLSCYYLSGIHPRCIPQNLSPGDVAHLLAPMLEDPLCLGIGEIGLECASMREQEVLTAQLELARSLKGRSLCIGVHTPRSNNTAVTRRTLDILKDFHDLMQDVVVDHCSAETLGLVLDAGFRAGITLSPSKTSLTEFVKMAASRADARQRLMCNTDSGMEFYEDLVAATTSAELPADVKAAVFHDNAAGFFFKGVQKR